MEVGPHALRGGVAGDEVVRREMSVLGKVPREEMNTFTEIVAGGAIALIILFIVSSVFERKDMAVKEYTTFGDVSNSIEGAFSADDVAELGTPVFTIDTVVKRRVGGQEGEDKTCVSFKEVSKYVVLNKTRSAQLTALFGADGTPSGKQVRLYVDLVKVNNMSHRMICFGAPE